MTKYKLLGIDLDGTLLSKLKRISKPNLEAIKDYIQQGGIPVVTTGRSIVSAEIFAKQLDAFSITKSPFVIAFNGAYIKDLTTNKIFENKISDSIVREIKKYTEGNKLILWAYTHESTEQKGVYVSRNFANFFIKLSKGINLMNLTESVKDLSSYKLNILSFRKSKIIKALAELENKYKGVLTFSHSHPKLIEINLFNVNKGSGIKFVAEQLKVNLNQVAVIGDSNNDLPAFLVSDLSIAVKTKSVILKEKATHYLGYKKNAVADAIRKYVLSSNSIQLVASDLDGTLLRNGTKEIDNFSKTTIIEMVDKLNKKFVVCTGRSIDDTLLVVDYFKFKNIKNVFAICVNGGCIYDIANKKYLFEHTMKEELVQRVLSIFHEFQNDKTLKGQIAIEAFLDYDNGSLIKKETQTHYLINKDYIYNYYLSRHPGMLTNFWAPRIHKLIDKHMPTHNVMKFIMHFDSLDDKARMVAKLDQYKNDYELSSSSSNNIEIMPVNISKGHALQRLCDYLNINIKDTMPIGDEKNDISMLSLSTNSVTLSSSSDIVRRSAGHVINAETSEIVGQAIKMFVLGKQ